MAEPKRQEVPQYSFKWTDATELPVVAGDVMHWRTAADRCYITIGQLNVPITDDAAFPDGTVFDVKPLVRLMVTPETVQMWAQLLTRAASEFPNAGAKK